MDRTVTVREMLRSRPGDALCDACLAFACSTSLTEVRTVTAALARSGEFRDGVMTCAMCGRLKQALIYAGTVKCAHCSQPVADDGLGIVLDGDHFHRTCWRVVISDHRIRLSRALSRQSRDAINRAREALDAPRPPEA